MLCLAKFLVRRTNSNALGETWECLSEAQCHEGCKPASHNEDVTHGCKTEVFSTTNQNKMTQVPSSLTVLRIPSQVLPI
eukprot:1449837-Amphidinium_carterae.1